MKIRQWEIWKIRPVGFEKDHWFVIVSGQERLDSDRHSQVNGVACFTLRGQPLKTDVRLNRADGFDVAATCQCDLIYFLDKTKLYSPLGMVSLERQRIIKAKIREVLRLN
jgi:mRNA-degrading endonuclease toxin of MazEF toxin-antitoxin module